MCILIFLIITAVMVEAFDEGMKDGMSKSSLSQLANSGRFKKLIEKFGQKALNFLKCMGEAFVNKCENSVESCFLHPKLFNCLEAIVCEGVAAVQCIHHLRWKGYNWNLDCLLFHYWLFKKDLMLNLKIDFLENL